VLITAARRTRELEECINEHHGVKEGRAEAKGKTLVRLDAISVQTKEFAGFAEDLARCALRNIQGELRRLEDILRDAEKESREKAALKRQHCQEIVSRTSQAIAHFDRGLTCFC
jgi:peptidyl-tRNA hydrolase